MGEVPPRSNGASAVITTQECIAVRDAALNCLAGFGEVRWVTDIIPKVKAAQSGRSMEFDVHQLHELEAALLDARKQWDLAWTPAACDWFHEHIPNPARRFGNQISASLWASQLLVAAEHDLRMAINGLLPECGMIPQMGGAGVTEADIEEEYLAAKRAIVVEQVVHQPLDPKQLTVATTPDETKQPNKHGYYDAGSSPPSKFCYGPLTGSEKEVAKWITPQNATPKSLRTRLRNATLWGRRDTRIQVSIFFATQSQFAAANTRSLK